MNIRTKQFYTTLMLLAGTPVLAQDSLRTKDFFVDKTYKPVLTEVVKIPSNPNPEIPEVKTPVFVYDTIPQQQLATTPTLYTIAPLAMGTSLLPRLKSNYTKIGYGNYNTPMLEVYLNTVRNKAIQAGFFAKHLSSNPSGNNTFSNNVANAFVKKFSPKGVLGADAFYYRNNVYLYGYPAGITPTPEKGNLQRLYSTFELKGSYANIVKDTAAVGYRIGAGYYNSSTNFGLTENDFKLTADISKRIQSNPLAVRIAVNMTSLKHEQKATSLHSRYTTPAEYDRVFVDVNPRYTLNMNGLYLRLGFNSTVFSDTNTAKIYFYPVAEAGLSLTKGLTAFTGLTGNLHRPTLRRISNENPFITSLQFRNTNNQFEFYGGVKGSLGPQTSFLVQAGWSSVTNLMFYAVDSAAYNGQVAIYDSSSAGLTNVKAEITHEFADRFRMALSFNYYRYELGFGAPYSRPTLTTKINGMYNFGDKFIFRADVFAMNERTALVLRQTSQVEEKFKGLVDMNLGVDYLYNRNVSVFINFNNIANNTYQRWYSYPVYGFNLIGGLTVSF